jgi:hypothetical protein
MEQDKRPSTVQKREGTDIGNANATTDVNKTRKKLNGTYNSLNGV